jgi:lipoate-protein ligase B
VARYLRLRGASDYLQVHQLQQRLVSHRAAGDIDDVVLLLEHAEVITLGRARDAQRSVLDAGEVPVVSVERGGDATWHGPGQLVAYPIVALQGRRADLHLHLHSLEDAVLTLLRDMGLPPVRDERNTGVWLPSPDGPPKKVCSIGIACRRWVTWHGLALNLTVDLSRFATIQPCGFDASVMTRVADHLPWSPSVQATAAPLARCLATALELPEGPVQAVDLSEVEATLGV